MKALPIEVTNESDAKQVIEYLQDLLGGGFHPDTPISEYINVSTDEPTFSITEVETLQPLLDAAFGIMGEEVYDYAWDLYVEICPAGTFDFQQD